ncbi:MAG: DUF1349 domain-containing protein [Bacteroidales bacterium]|nr:DUF1349 domain-containing protein [Bacteroidales bacterium]MCD8394169.1 DUF1349 domain-containing protein [Bacteroidales bacterium]
MALASCGTKVSAAESVQESTTINSNMEKCNINLAGVKFDNWQNAANCLELSDSNTIRIQAGESTDLFCDPKGKATNLTAPIIHSTIDNTKPFTFTVKVTPAFTPEGTYSAGALLIFEDNYHWQKLCFEQDEDGNHRIVTVRTIETSDDNNHHQVESASVYLRMSSDGQVIGNYYSEDGEKWYLVRIYKNDYPATLYLSLSAQSPKDESHVCTFSDVALEHKAVSNFRSGTLDL